MSSTEVLIKELGGCGPFQVLLVFFIAINITPICVSVFYMSYGIYNPGWRCLDNMTDASTGATSVSPVGVNQTSEYQVYTCVGYETCQHIEFNPEANTLVTEWGLICGRASIIPVMISIEMAGSLVGMVLIGYIGDKYGRKIGMQISVTIMFVLNIVAIFSVSWVMYSSLSFFWGMALSMLAPAQCLMSEYVTPKWRIGVMSLPYWSISITLFSVCAMLIRDWKILRLIISGLAAISFIVLLWVPESLRWLSVVGKEKKSLKVVRKIANINKAGELPANLAQLSCNTNERGDKNTVPLLSLLRKEYKYVTFVIGFSFFVLDMLYFAITFGISSLPGNMYTNMIILAVTELPSNMISVSTANSFGRKKPTFTCFILSALCFFGVVVVNRFFDANAIATLVLVVVLKVFLSVCWYIMSTVTVEVYPTYVRSKMMSYAHLMRMLGAVVAPYLIPHDPETFYVSYLVMGVLTVVGAILVVFIPETKGKQLEDIKIDGDKRESQ